MSAASREVVWGEHVAAHMVEWAEQHQARGDNAGDSTSLLVIGRLKTQGLLVDMVNHPLSKALLVEIIEVLETMYRNESKVYLNGSTSVIKKRLAKEILMLVDLAMKDCGHVQ
jgi:hypothetical protein